MQGVRKMRINSHPTKGKEGRPLDVALPTCDSKYLSIFWPVTRATCVVALQLQRVTTPATVSDKVGSGSMNTGFDGNFQRVHLSFERHHLSTPLSTRAGDLLNYGDFNYLTLTYQGWGGDLTIEVRLCGWVDGEAHLYFLTLLKETSVRLWWKLTVLVKKVRCSQRAGYVLGLQIRRVHKI